MMSEQEWKNLDPELKELYYQNLEKHAKTLNEEILWAPDLNFGSFNKISICSQEDLRKKIEENIDHHNFEINPFGGLIGCIDQNEEFIMVYYLRNSYSHIDMEFHPSLEIYEVVVPEMWRGRGIASQIISRLEEKAKLSRLNNQSVTHVLVRSVISKEMSDLLERQGYQPCGGFNRCKKIV